MLYIIREKTAHGYGNHEHIVFQSEDKQEAIKHLKDYEIDAEQHNLQLEYELGTFNPINV